MIEIKYENGKFLAKGTFSMGIAGVYENKDFDADDITVDIELDELLADLQRKKPFLYEPMVLYLDIGGNFTGELHKFSVFGWMGCVYGRVRVSLV